MEPYNSKEKAGTKDKVKFTDTWIMIIQRATLMKAKTNWFMFIHTVKTLIDVLFDDERKDVAKFTTLLQREQPNMNKVQKYDYILTHIIDILEAKGYLSAEISFAYGGGDDTEVGGDSSKDINEPIEKKYGLEPL